jgi:hypothetical protein
MHSQLRFIVILLLQALMVAGCSDEKGINIEPFQLNANIDDQFELLDLGYSERPYFYPDHISLDLNFPHDDRGIKLDLINNVYYYHPYTLVAMGLQYLSGYYVTGDSAYLTLVNNYANKLNEIGTRYNDGVYITYTFNFRLHPIFNDVMMAPWFSGLTQGFALNFISRTYEITGNPTMKYFADSLFNTFLHWDVSAPIWTVAIDSAGYYWIEEYPYQPFDHVMGGFINSILGLHNYFLVTNDQQCKAIYKAACTTIAHYFDEYRNPGDLCYYCLLHRVKTSPTYHTLDAFRLRQLHTVSGHPLFEAYAESLDVDYAAWSDTL